MVFAVGKRLRRRHYNTFAGMDAQRIEIFHVTNRDHIVETIANHFILYLFPAFQRFFNQHLTRIRKGFFGQVFQFSPIAAKAAALSAEGKCRPNNDRKANFEACFERCFNRCNSHRAGCFDINRSQQLRKHLAVFGFDNGFNGRSQHTQSIFFKDPLLVKRDATVQSRLSAKSQQNALRLLLLDDFFDKKRCNRQKINGVGNLLRGLHRGDVGIDKNGMYPFFFKGF